MAQTPCPRSNAIKRSACLGLVNSGGVGHKAGYGSAVTRNDDLLPVFDAVEEHAELILCFKGSDFHVHASLSI
jgi:hypothetical protein